MNIFVKLFLQPPCGPLRPCQGSQANSSKASQLEPARQKRPPASPAHRCGRSLEKAEPGQTPILSPEVKKNKVAVSPSGSQQSSRVIEYQEKVMRESESPVAPDLNVTEEYLDREDPEPKSLNKDFEASAEDIPDPVPTGDHAPCLNSF